METSLCFGLFKLGFSFLFDSWYFSTHVPYHIKCHKQLSAVGVLCCDRAWVLLQLALPVFANQERRLGDYHWEQRAMENQVLQSHNIILECFHSNSVPSKSPVQLLFFRHFSVYSVLSDMLNLYFVGCYYELKDTSTLCCYKDYMHTHIMSEIEAPCHPFSFINLNLCRL